MTNGPLLVPLWSNSHSGHVYCFLKNETQQRHSMENKKKRDLLSN